MVKNLNNLSINLIARGVFMKKYNIFVMLLGVLLGFQLGCAHYSNEKSPLNARIINAPPETVWQETLKILPQERIEIFIANNFEKTIWGKKDITLWSDGDEVKIKIIPYNHSYSILNIDIKANNQFVGWAYQTDLGKKLFARIKRASETRVKASK